MRKLNWPPETPWMLALIGLLSLHLWFPPMAGGLLDDTFSVELAGKKALYLLAQQEFDGVVRNEDPLSDEWNYPDPGDALCLLGPHREPSPLEWKTMLSWVARGGLLIVAARWNEPEFEIPDIDAKIESVGGRVIDDELHGRDADDWAKRMVWDAIGPKDDVRWKSKGEIVGDDISPLLEVNDTVQAGIVSHGNGWIVLIASDYIFSNQSLAWKDDVLVARALLSSPINPEFVVFDESLNNSGTPKVVGLLLDPYFRPLTLQIAVCLLVFGWWGNRRFGPLISGDAPPRHDVTAHTNALGNLYYKTNAAQTVLHAYLEQLRLELRIRTGLHVERILAPIARRMDRPVEDLVRLLSAAENASKSAHLDRRDAAQLIRHLAEVRMAAKR